MSSKNRTNFRIVWNSESEIIEWMTAKKRPKIETQMIEYHNKKHNHVQVSSLILNSYSERYWDHYEAGLLQTGHDGPTVLDIVQRDSKS